MPLSWAKHRFIKSDVFRTSKYTKEEMSSLDLEIGRSQLQTITQEPQDQVATIVREPHTHNSIEPVQDASVVAGISPGDLTPIHPFQIDSEVPHMLDP
ncbi:hypothetical protein PG996_004769 [Apiospora saccharicola]|uniref:Uncharacterized protein n=1 Tax=Apiospora saccharicola TaxID=335842 RepID=A0ABR1W542_9PEZI